MGRSELWGVLIAGRFKSRSFSDETSHSQNVPRAGPFLSASNYPMYSPLGSCDYAVCMHYREVEIPGVFITRDLFVLH